MTYAITGTGIFQWTVKSSADLENQVTCNTVSLALYLVHVKLQNMNITLYHAFDLKEYSV